MAVEIDLGPSPSLLERIPGCRYLPETGLYEGNVRLDQIYTGDVPRDFQKIKMLAELMAAEAAKRPGTVGQQMPILIGEVIDFPQFPMIDGFHREGALALRGESFASARIRPQMDWPEVIDQRILHATSVTETSFARIVEWIGQAWTFKEWSDRITVAQAFNLTSSSTTTGERLGITPKDVEDIREWVNSKCSEWRKVPGTIYSFLKTAEVADSELIHEARARSGGRKLEALTPRHVRLIADELPNRYDFQRLVSEASKTGNLTAEDAGVLAFAVKQVGTVAEVEEIIRSGSWKRFLAPSTPIVPVSPSHDGPEVDLREIARRSPGEVIKFHYGYLGSEASQEDRFIKSLLGLGIYRTRMEAEEFVRGNLNLFDRVGFSASFRHGEIIHHEQDAIGSLGLLRAGGIFVFNSDPYNANRTINEFLDPPAVLGSGVLIGQEYYTNSAEAFTDCIFQNIRRDQLGDIIQNNPQLIVFLLLAQTIRMQAMEKRMGELSVKDAESRIARALLNLAERDSLPHHITQLFLGESAGYTREATNKILSDWERSGVIVWRNRGPELLHREKITKIASG